MTQAELLRYLVEVLEGIGIDYMISGSRASVYSGEPRLTIDIDVAADVTRGQVRALLERVRRHRLPEPRYGRLRVDGLRDILANKLAAMVEGTEPKDYADVMFILRQPGFSLPRGMEDGRTKFGWPGLHHLLQRAFLYPEHFRGWVENDPPTALVEAREYFRDLARSLVDLDDARSN